MIIWQARRGRARIVVRAQKGKYVNMVIIGLNMISILDVA